MKKTVLPLIMANTSYQNKKEESREEDLEKMFWEEYADFMTIF